MIKLKPAEKSYCVECGALLPDPLAGTTRLWGQAFGLCNRCLFIDPRKDEEFNYEPRIRTGSLQSGSD